MTRVLVYLVISTTVSAIYIREERWCYVHVVDAGVEYLLLLLCSAIDTYLA